MFDYLVQYPELLLLTQLLLYTPGQLITAIGPLYLLDIRKKGLFVCSVMTIFLVNTSAASLMPPVLNIVLGIGLYLATLFFFSHDRLPRRILLIILIRLFLVLAEVPPTVYWLSITNIPPNGIDAITLYGPYLIFARIIHIATLVLLFCLLKIADVRISKKRTDLGALLFTGFLLIQYVTLAVAINMMEFSIDFNSGSLIGLAVVTAVCIAVDIICFYYLDLFNRSLQTYWQTRLMQAELDLSLALYQNAEQGLESMARIRHDLRNQANVVLFLIEHNDIVEAKKYLDSLQNAY